MSSIAFVTWDGGGNQAPAIGLAQELAARGHRIHFLGLESQRGRLQALGFEFSALAAPDAAFTSAPPNRRLQALFNFSGASPAHLLQAPALLRSKPPDLVVVDCLMLTVLESVRASGLPVVSLFHSSPGAFVAMAEDREQTGSGLMAAANRARSSAGLPPASTGWDLWSEYRTVVASIEELESVGGLRPSTFQYVGPLSPRVGPTDDAGLLAGDRPLVVASLSTMRVFGDPIARLQRIADAIAPLDVRLLVTCGRAADPAELHLPPNAAAVSYADHRLLLPKAGLCISHGGHGTVSSALAAGVPILAMPNPMTDQPYLAARIAELGVGRRLDRNADSYEIRDAVAEVLANPSYRRVAAGLCESIATCPGVAGAAETLESILAGW